MLAYGRYIDLKLLLFFVIKYQPTAAEKKNSHVNAAHYYYTVLRNGFLLSIKIGSCHAKLILQQASDIVFFVVICKIFIRRRKLEI